MLWPLALPYGAAVHLRARAYKKGILRQRHLAGKVISVGNLTVGGTGKTPMVLWIAGRLAAEGKSVGILTRGYRGRSHVLKGNDSANCASDEVQLLKARLGDRVAFGVGADRFARGRELIQRGVNWFVLDDGFQHLQLARNVDIVLLDAKDPFGGGRLLPAGRLRESRTALRRADIIVITRSRHAPGLEAAIRRDSEAPVFYTHTKLDSVHVLGGGYPDEENRKAQAQRHFAFCGIGNPSAFIADLQDWGFQVAGQRFFPDHHRYTQQDVEKIETEARQTGAEAILCTEKDVFNLGGVKWGAFDVSYCRISMQINGEDAFWRVLKARAEAKENSGT
jgi:tetraacyldisaccharide 4'-kinase